MYFDYIQTVMYKWQYNIPQNDRDFAKVCILLVIVCTDSLANLAA